MDLLPWNLVCSIGISGSIVVYSDDDWLAFDPIYIKVKFGRIWFCMEKVEIFLFLFIYLFILETIVACELKFCICNQLNE